MQNAPWAVSNSLPAREVRGDVRGGDGRATGPGEGVRERGERGCDGDEEEGCAGHRGCPSEGWAAVRPVPPIRHTPNGGDGLGAPSVASLAAGRKHLAHDAHRPPHP